MYAACAAGLAGKHHARLSHTLSKAIVKVAEIHADAVYGEGNRAKFHSHARIKHHADALAAHLAENPGKETAEFPQKRQIGKNLLHPTKNAQAEKRDKRRKESKERA